jgi:hypothetical protein
MHRTMKRNLFAPIFLLLLMPFVLLAGQGPLGGAYDDPNRIAYALLLFAVIPFINAILILINCISVKHLRHPILYFRLPMNILSAGLLIIYINSAQPSYFLRHSYFYFWEVFTSKEDGTHLFFILYVIIIAIDAYMMVKLRSEKKNAKRVR